MNQDNLPQTQEDPVPFDNTPCDSERTLSLLQKIQTGALDPKTIRLEERRQVVSYLTADGYSAPDLAQILQVSDRSIERDKRALRQANAIVADPQLVEQMVGRLISEAELCVQRIRRAVRDKGTPRSVVVDAEHRCFQIVNEMTISLQRLGYLPTAAARLQAAVTHNMEQIPELPQLDMETERLMQLTTEIQGTDPRIVEQLSTIRTQIITVQLADRIQTISKVLEENKGESDHES
jgi:hypothetical protein